MIELIETIRTKNNNEVRLLKTEPHFSNSIKNILYIGVFHGDEPDGEYLIKKFMDKISINPELYKNRLFFIPCLNPDGKILNRRGNANGVDLNRNFPTKNWELSKEKDEYYSGETPASEIETKFLISVIEKYKPDVILSIHSPYRVVNYDGHAHELAEKISELNGYPVSENIGYPTPGSFGTYAGIERNIPVITLELPENVPQEILWEENKEVLRLLGSV
jgi:protein MpaA